MSDSAVYHNPIVPGYNPDPSIVQVDGIFYLVTSTFQIFPGLPIYASTNLEDWKLIGHGLHRKEQLSLFYVHTRVVHLDTGNNMIATCGLQAPTIRHYKDKFYIVGTNTTREDPDAPIRDNFIISTSDIWNGEWSDPVHFDFHGIDTSFFVDDDDRLYIQGSWLMDRAEQPSCTIHQVELDLATGKALSATRLIWEGHFRYDTEAPHIYKRGDWYYLLVAEGGTFENHKLSISRSKNIWGPYETYEKNPILAAKNDRHEIQGLGHGDLFQDADGDWWIVALGFRSHNGIWPLGRETFLSKVCWPLNMWPEVQPPELSFESKKILATRSLPPSDAISDIVHLRGRNDDNYQIQMDGNVEVLRLWPSEVKLGDLAGLPTFLGRRQPDLLATAQVSLDLRLASIGAHAIAGLTLYIDPLRYAYLAIDYAKTQLQFEVVSCTKGIDKATYHEYDPLGSFIKLKISASIEEYSFAFAQEPKNHTINDEEVWRVVGSISTADLWERSFTGPLFGIFAETESASELCGSATFRGFQTKAGGKAS